MFIANQSPLHGEPLLERDQRALGVEAASEVAELLKLCPAHRPTALRQLPNLARPLGIGQLSIKDEATRLGVGSFKALGGAYAVFRTILTEAGLVLGRPVGAPEIFTAEVRRIARNLTVACATDGNHGRSVAAGARAFGCRAVVFVPLDVSENRADAIQAYGATVMRINGAYDDAVQKARSVCAQQGWTLLSDTATHGDDDAPLMIMQGYTAMAHEALSELFEPPTHIFAQGGVGGLAGAIGAYFEDALGTERPRLIMVQPAWAACYLRSYEAGRPVRIRREKPTVMAMLDCHEPSEVGWRILIRVADAFMTVEEQDAIDAMNILARPADGDPPIIGGESGLVGFAGLKSVLADPDARSTLDLGENSRVLLFNSEGATDPARYEELTGLKAAPAAAWLGG